MFFNAPRALPRGTLLRCALLHDSESMAQVWFWLVIMVAIVVATIAVIVHFHSGGAREFALEMRGPKAEGDAEAAAA